MTKEAKQEILDQALATLKDIALIKSIKQTKNPKTTANPTTVISIKTPHHNQNYLAQNKTITTTNRNAIIQQLQQLSKNNKLQPLLITNHESPPNPDILKQKGINYNDTARNMHLENNAFYIHIEGKKPNKQQTPKDAFSYAGLKLIYALLAYPDLKNKPYRDIQKATNIGLASISRTIKSLTDQNQIIKTNTQLHLTQSQTLLERWEIGYLETLRPKLEPSSWKLTTINKKEILKTLKKEKHTLIGGEETAANLSKTLKPQTLTLHASANTQKDLRIKFRLLPEKNNIQVYLLKPILPHDLTNPHNKLANAIRARAELLAYGGDRLFETASVLLNEHILPELNHAE